MIAMKPVDDNELILYHYRDGLDPSRIAAITTILSESDALRSRYQRLCRVLAAAEVEVPDPPSGFEQRLWAGFEARTGKSRIPATSAERREWIRTWFASHLVPRLAIAGGLAGLLIVSLAVGYLAGRNDASEQLVGAPAPTPTMAQRVLDDHVAGHLRATEGLLLTAVNEKSGELRLGQREVAESLVVSNRMYAAAAARSGNLRLADFLRQLEPVLIEVANQPTSSSIEDMQGLREYLRNTDLLFQVRATESRIEVADKRSL